MARYIDADKLIEERTIFMQDEEGFDTSVVLVADIKLTPTADVAEVKHGEWELKSEIHQLFDDVDEECYVECPFCKRCFYIPFEFEDEKMLEYARRNYPYCNCGAKMDGGKI